ncbi:MAG: TIGR00366 family protein [Pseudomonadota bacterium]
MDGLTAPLVRFMERYYPDLFLFIFIMTLATFFFAWWFADYPPQQIVTAWGSSLQDILAFSMQMALMVMISHALAHTDAVQRLLQRLCSWPNSQFQAYSFVVLIVGIICFFSWPLGVIAGGIIARKVAESARDRGLKIHYPLLVAGAFCGNVIWHMGYSASAPLFVATENNSMIGLLGGVIPVTETVFTAWNLGLAAMVLISISLLAALMRPADDAVIELLADPEQYPEQQPLQADPERPVSKLENSRAFSLLIGLCLLAYLVIWFTERGFTLNLNVVNWSFLALTLLLCRSAKHFMFLVERAALAAGPLILAYPFYAGIIGVMTDSGMASMMADWFAGIASAQTLPMLAFACAMVINLFIPSGGAQWMVQGPIFIEAATDMGVDLPLIVMAIAYGDQLTNLLQPLPAIPLLALAGLRLKHIMGYSLVFFVVATLILGAGFALVCIASV